MVLAMKREGFRQCLGFFTLFPGTFHCSQRTKRGVTQSHLGGTRQDDPDILPKGRAQGDSPHVIQG